MTGASAQEIGRRVRALRLERGMSGVDLARAAGMKPPHLARLERGPHDPSLRILRAVATALGVDVADLVSAEPRG